MFDTSKSIVQELKISSFKERGIRLLVKRDDLIDEHVSGNKWRKLKYNVELCYARKNEGVLTFGGAYSNHLVATAAACKKAGLKSIGIVRGDELNAQSNDTLKMCDTLGMELLFVSRQEYMMRHEKMYHEELMQVHSNYFIVPEGGANYYGMIGCQEVLKEVEEEVDHVFVAQGTSTTSCGLLMGLRDNQHLHVVPVLKGYDSIAEMTSLFGKSGMEKEWVEEQLEKVSVHPEFHFGGYGKYSQELLEFIQRFWKEHTVKLDPVYTGKVMYALTQELNNVKYNNTTVLFIHTGGIQGAKPIEQKSGVHLYR